MTQLHTKLASVALLAIFSFSALPAQAVTREPENIRKSLFCDAGLQELTRLQTRKTEWDNKISNSRSRRNELLEKSRSNKDKFLENTREKKSTRVETRAQKLLEKAKTDEQKAAVEKFIATADTALKTRQAAVDAAIAEFRAAVDAKLTARKAAVDAALKKFRESVAAALTTAKSACASGGNPTDIREKLKGSLEAAKKQLTEDLKNIRSTSQEIDSLEKTKNEKIRAAFSAYNKTLEAAKKELKEAFEN